MNMHINNTDTL